jgi:hypothetical protein
VKLNQPCNGSNKTKFINNNFNTAVPKITMPTTKIKQTATMKTPMKKHNYTKTTITTAKTSMKATTTITLELQ